MIFGIWSRGLMAGDRKIGGQYWIFTLLNIRFANLTGQAPYLCNRPDWTF